MPVFKKIAITAIALMFAGTAAAQKAPPQPEPSAKAPPAAEAEPAPAEAEPTPPPAASTQGTFEDGQAAYNAYDYETALRIWRPLAEQGDPAAQNALAGMYELGLGTAEDIAEAVHWYQLAAEQNFTTISLMGYPTGPINDLTRLAEDGEQLALAALVSLADAGNAAAQTGLGNMYAGGEGVEQDFDEAARLFTLAADQADPDGQFYLGLLYMMGYGVPQDYDEAFRLATLAVEQHQLDAMALLGYLYQNGLGVAQDNVLAYMWFDLGNYGSDRADVAELMTDDEIAEARRMAQEWRDAHPN